MLIKENTDSWQTVQANIEELTVQLHGVMLRRTKNEVLDLPPKVRTWLDVELHPYAVQHFNNAVREFLTKFDAPEPIEDVTENTERRQAVGRLTTARRKLAFAKCRQTIKFVENALEQGEKVILFTAFLNTLGAFSQAFR